MLLASVAEAQYLAGPALELQEQEEGNIGLSVSPLLAPVSSEG